MRVRVRALDAEGENNACNDQAPTFTHALFPRGRCKVKGACRQVRTIKTIAALALRHLIRRGIIENRSYELPGCFSLEARLLIDLVDFEISHPGKDKPGKLISFARVRFQAKVLGGLFQQLKGKPGRNHRRE